MSGVPSHGLVILGAGPVGLDAALAALEAGKDFLVLEQGARVAGNVRDWGHVRMFSPWSLNVSPRMSEALRAAGMDPPDGEGEPPTGSELVTNLLDPVSRLPALAGRIRTGARVVSISREGFLKDDEIGTGRRAERPFRVLWEDPEGGEHVVWADVVLDCTGSWHHPNWLGQGGIPAIGERRCTGIVRRIPDLSHEEADWADRRILLVGGGHSAFTALRLLADLAEAHPSTRVTWALRRPSPRFETFEDDPLPARSELVRAAEAIARAPGPGVQVLAGRAVHEIDETPEGIRVTLVDGDGEFEDLMVDRVVSLIGSSPDRTLYQQLQVHECYATQGPMKLAAALLSAGGGADCLAQESHGVAVLQSPEPNFYILGSKSYGRNNTFLLKVGFDQVSEVFAELANRDVAAA